MDQPIERCYSVKEVAQMWSLSTDWVRELFENFPGVIELGTTRSSRLGHGYKRKYTTLRIPASVLAEFQKSVTQAASPARKDRRLTHLLAEHGWRMCDGIGVSLHP